MTTCVLLHTRTQDVTKVVDDLLFSHLFGVFVLESIQ